MRNSQNLSIWRLLSEMCLIDEDYYHRLRAAKIFVCSCFACHRSLLDGGIERTLKTDQWQYAMTPTDSPKYHSKDKGCKPHDTLNRRSRIKMRDMHAQTTEIQAQIPEIQSRATEIHGQTTEIQSLASEGSHRSLLKLISENTSMVLSPLALPPDDNQIKSREVTCC
jgi:hypothetical protein